MLASDARETFTVSLLPAHFIETFRSAFAAASFRISVVALPLVAATELPPPCFFSEATTPRVRLPSFASIFSEKPMPLWEV